MHLFLMPGYLRDKASHPYSETLGWRRYCADNGIALDIFGHRLLEPEVIAATGARPAFGLSDEEAERLAFVTDSQRDPVSVRLDEFMRGAHSALAACRLAWATAAGRTPDAVIFPWGHQGQISGIADWLAEVPPAERPKVAVNIVRPEDDWVADAERKHVSGDFAYMRFAGRRLRSLLGEDRLVITAVDPRLCRTLSWLCGTEVHPIAPHVTYPTDSEFAAWRSSSPDGGVTIGLMGPNRSEKAGANAPAIMQAVAGARPQARFFIQSRSGTDAALMAQGLEGRGVRLAIQVGALEHEAYWRRLLANDLMLMPYQGKDYALTPSGPFCEAVASGIPVVAPRETWMGDRVTDGSGAGELFDSLDVEAVAAATVRAIDRLPELKSQAAARAPAWLRTMSLDAHISGILRLLGLR